MRGLGDFRHLLTLYAKDGAGRATVRLGAIYAGRCDLSGREFLQLGADHQESTVIFTMRRPIRFELDSGVEAEDARGRRWRAVDVVPSMKFNGCIDVRCVSTRLEGMGYV